MEKKKIFIENTFMLYILTFSNYFFGVITIPYQTRVLGPEIYGLIGFATAFSVYLQQFLDFGFILSATDEISRNREDKEKVSKIFSATIYCKLLLGLFAFLLTMLLIILIPKFNNNALLYLLYFGYVFINSLMPDYLYRGLEKMNIITIRTIIIKFISTMLIFIFLTSKEKYYIIPIALLTGALFSIITIYAHMYLKLGIKFRYVKIKDVLLHLKKASFYFLSRIATTIYTTSNTLILGFIYPTGNTVGLYSSSEKMITTGRNAISPISDSLYPYMVKHKDFVLANKIMKIFFPLIIIVTGLIFIFARPICILVFGKSYADASNILRCMLPLIVLTLPTYIFGFPVLSAMGKAHIVNLSTIIGAVVQIIGLLILMVINCLNVYSICILTDFTEFIVCTIRTCCYFKNRNCIIQSQ